MNPIILNLAQSKLGQWFQTDVSWHSLLVQLLQTASNGHEMRVNYDKYFSMFISGVDHTRLHIADS